MRDSSNVDAMVLKARIALDAGDTAQARELVRRARAAAPQSEAVGELAARLGLDKQSR